MEASANSIKTIKLVINILITNEIYNKKREK